MVWGLFPIDSNRGTLLIPDRRRTAVIVVLSYDPHSEKCVQTYYFLSKGTYKVGRKDCDVIVQTDTSISRVHAEIVIEEMISQDPVASTSSNSPSSVLIIDRSKFGTVINKELGPGASRLKKDQEIMLKDGDFVTFGNGTATFRFSYVPLIIFLHTARSRKPNPVLQAKLSAIGGSVTSNWGSECTHVVVEKSSPVTHEIIQAVIARKPIVLNNWIDMLAGKSICTELPSCTPYIPELALNEASVKVVDPGSREKILENYTFVLRSAGSGVKYIFEDSFKSLLELVGAKCVSTDEFCSNSQTSQEEYTSEFVLVIPSEPINNFNLSRELSPLSRVTDMNLVAAVLSGHMDSSIIEQPPCVISSSHSTDETIVADSDVEMDTGTSNHVNASFTPHVQTDNDNENKEVKVSDCIREMNISVERDNIVTHSTLTSVKSKASGPIDDSVGVIKRAHKNDETRTSKHENSDIIYSQELIVRNVHMQHPPRSTTSHVVNFKSFRKKEIASGNSFSSLIPFSKDLYKASGFGSDDTSEYMRKEKKRKQMEAIADDLFNNEKARKRATAGASLRALFDRQ